MIVYKIKWAVPIPDMKDYKTHDYEQAFKHKRTAVRFKNQLINCYDFIGLPDATSYIKLIEEDVI